MTKVHWNLGDIMSQESFNEMLASGRSDLPKFEKFYETFSRTMTTDDFKAYLDFSDAVSEKLHRLYYLASLQESTNQKSTSAKSMKSKVKDLWLKINDTTEKMSHWFMGIKVEGKETLDDENATRLFAAVPDLTYSLHRARDSAKYTLSEREEMIVRNFEHNGISVLTDLRSVMETDFTFSFHPKNLPEPKIIRNQSELTSFIFSSDPDERESAYRALHTEYQNNGDKLFMIYQSVVKNWCYMQNMRGYPTPISVRNHGNDVPDDAITALLAVCSEQANIFWPFFKYKAQALGLEKLRRFDIYAPLKESQHTFSYDEAVSLVLESLETFSPTFAGHAREIIDKQHVDSHPDEYKQSGAFCATVSPSVLPYVLLNFTGKSTDVRTLAHELGHGVHSIYAKHHSISTQHASLPLAETASTLAEIIVFEAMLEKVTDKVERNAMLADQIMQTYATVIRQNYFVAFEIAAHEMIPKGADSAELSQFYETLLKEQFGSAVDIDPIFIHEWLFIPHIVQMPFYCYSYSFGKLLSLTLYADYKKKGKDFVPVIERILAAGGSENPTELLKSCGYDITGKAFWESGFSIIKSWIDQLVADK